MMNSNLDQFFLKKKGAATATMQTTCSEIETAMKLFVTPLEKRCQLSKQFHTFCYGHVFIRVKGNFHFFFNFKNINWQFQYTHTQTNLLTEN